MSFSELPEKESMLSWRKWLEKHKIRNKGFLLKCLCFLSGVLCCIPEWRSNWSTYFYWSKRSTQDHCQTWVWRVPWWQGTFPFVGETWRVINQKLFFCHMPESVREKNGIAVQFSFKNHLHTSSVVNSLLNRLCFSVGITASSFH